MHLGVLRNCSKEELSCEHTTAFLLKVFCKTDTNVSYIFFDEDIQVLVLETTFREVPDLVLVICKAAL